MAVILVTGMAFVMAFIMILAMAKAGGEPSSPETRLW